MLAPVLLSLAGGMFSVLAMCPLRKIAWQFLRLVGVIELALAIGILSWWFVGTMTVSGRAAAVSTSAAGALALFAFAAVGLAPMLRAEAISIARWLRVLAIGGGLAGVLAAWAWPGRFEASTAGGVLLLASGHVLGALLLGSATVAWLLGHRYLTATEMTIDPLRRAVQVVLGVLVARWIFGAAVLAAACAAPAGDGAAAFTPISAEWLMIAIRVGVGLFLPSVFAWMAWDCVRLRSTQSATGILFFMSIFVIIGELTSQYLTGRLGWPV